MAGDENALNNGIVGLCRQGAAVCKLPDTDKTVGGHVVAADKERLRLPRTPVIESLVVESRCLVVDIRTFVGDVAVDDRTVWYLHVAVVADRGRKTVFTPHSGMER